MPKNKKDTQDTETPEVSKKEEDKEEVSFTDEQQEKINELMTSRLSRAEEQWKEKLEKIQKEAEEQVAKAKEEGERLAKLSAKEKEEELLKKQKEESEKREKLLSQRENKLDAIALFSEKEVPTELVDYVVTTNKEETLENAERFIEKYKKSVEKTVAQKLEGKPPKDVEGEEAPKSGLKPAY
jgi:hypothetical protein